MKKQLFLVLGTIFCNQFCLAGHLDTYSQTGRVIDYRGEPVSGAAVVCYHYDSNFLNITPLASKLCDTIYTSLDGTFSFDINKKRCISLIVVYKSGLALGWVGMNLEKELSPTVRLGKPTILKGMVVDEKGNPIENADVRVYLRNEMMSRPEDIDFDLPDPKNWYSRKTDSQGQFLFNNIPEGSYGIFQAKAPGKASICVERDNKSYTEYFAAGREDIRIVLPEEARIKGKVINENTGLAISDIQVKAEFCKKDSFLYPEKVVQTDSNGVFEFIQLESHKYQLSIKDDKKGYGYVNIDIESGQTIDDVKIIYKKGIPFKVKVCEFGDEKVIKDVSVTIYQKDIESGHERFSQKKITDVNGIARFNIPPGESLVEVIKYNYGGNIFDDDDLRKINPENESEIEIAIPRSAFFYSGQVVDESGNPLAGAKIIGERFEPSVFADSNGCFDSSNIQIYYLSLPSGIDLLARYEPENLAGLARLKDPNKAGHASGKIVLKPAYTIRGKVTDPNGKAIPAAYVQLVEGQVCSLIAEVATDSNGRYTICSVPYPRNDLNYFIVAYGHGYNHVVGGQVSFTDDVTKPIEMQTIELLPEDKVISGIVVDANDQPVPNAILSINYPRLLQNYRSLYYAKIFTDKEGRFYYKGVSEEPAEIYAKPPTKQQKSGKIFARGGDTDMKIVLGQTLYYSRSLIGKEFPILKEFGIDSIKDGKKILLCFFDIEQRPSRNSILELNKRIQGLNEKGIEVVAIKASTSEQSELNNWVKENNISFQIGMIQEDWEKARTEWGIEALPWMILTDKEHIVIAEGFSINEIDEKIGEIQ